MEKITITEALSELNLIKKKVEKKTNTIMGCLIKPKHVKDPLESEGGSKEFIQRETQSIEDLLKRFTKIKGEIAKANVQNNITVNNRTASIHDWLIWKRDVFQIENKFLNSVHVNTKQALDRAQSQPQVYKDDEGKTHLLETESNVDYGTYLKKAEESQDMFDKLDGQLSLKNATIVIDL